MKSLALLTALLLSGCSAMQREGALVDDTYRKRVKSFSITFAIAPPAVIGTWDYNSPFKQFADDAK